MLAQKSVFSVSGSRSGLEQEINETIISGMKRNKNFFTKRINSLTFYLVNYTDSKLLIFDISNESIIGFSM